MSVFRPKPSRIQILQYFAGYGQGELGRIWARSEYKSALGRGEYPASTNFEGYLTHKARMRMSKGSTVILGGGQPDVKELEKLRRKQRGRGKGYASTILAGGGPLGVATTRKQILG